MATNLTVNNVTFSYPQTGDVSWGDAATNWAAAVTTGMLQKAGGAFTLTAETDFGPNYGLKSLYYKSRATNPADAGQLRLGNTETVSWRNAGNSANLNLAASASDRLTFGGVNVPTISSTDTLTNKTMSGASNTFSSIGYSSLSLAGSIVNADISTSAAIARSKVAAGSNNHVVINDGSGNLFSEASLAITRGGTGQTTASAAFDALAPTSAKGDIIVRNSSTNTNQPIGTDGQVLVADSSQAVGLKWTTLNQGAKNYITYNNFENNATTGWSLSHTTLSSNVPNQASGSWTAASGSLAISTVSSGQLAGNYSLQMAWTGTTSVAGDMLVSQAYTVDKEDQAKVLTGKFYFSVTAGASLLNFSGTVNNTYQIYIYDVANSAWIQPAGAYGMTQSSGVGYCTFTFQTPSNMTQFRLAIVCINASSSGSHTILFDDFSVGPQTAPLGAVITDWQSYTPTISPISGYASSWSPQGFWRRVGQNMEGYIKWRKDTNAGTGASALTFSLPSGYTIDTSITEATDTTVGFAKVYNFVLATAYDRAYGLNAASTTTIGMRKPGAAGVLVGTDVGANAEFYAHFTVPIVGWSSNVQMSNDTDTRVVAASANLSSGSHGTSGSYLILSGGTWSIEKDTHAAMSTSGTYSVPASGWYELSGSIGFVSNATGVRGIAFYRNSVSITTPSAQPAITTGQDTTLTGSALVYCSTGDTLNIGGYQNSGGSLNYGAANNETRFSVKRLSGPSVVAATESVNATYTNATGTFNSSPNVVKYSTLGFDSHSAYSTSTGLFTCPVSGKFHVSAAFFHNAATEVADESLIIYVYKNGAAYRQTNYRQYGNNSGASAQISCDVSCNAGDTIAVYSASSSTTPAYANSALTEFISIYRIGN